MLSVLSLYGVTFNWYPLTFQSTRFPINWSRISLSVEVYKVSKRKLIFFFSGWHSLLTTWSSSWEHTWRRSSPGRSCSLVVDNIRVDTEDDRRRQWMTVEASLLAVRVSDWWSIWRAQFRRRNTPRNGNPEPPWMTNFRNPWRILIKDDDTD